jgi:uncharacterized protein YodC (DUF2158 family)
MAQTKNRMEEKDFNVGDVVFLNSGSPQMTIKFINEDKTFVNVIYWNVATFKFEEATFATDIISIVQYSETL